jgi:hypothetical protein
MPNFARILGVMQGSIGMPATVNRACRATSILVESRHNALAVHQRDDVEITIMKAPVLL